MADSCLNPQKKNLESFHKSVRVENKSFPGFTYMALNKIIVDLFIVIVM